VKAIAKPAVAGEIKWGMVFDRNNKQMVSQIARWEME
jgi:hypothetical protein